MDIKTTPFISAEEAWFWFMQANLARNDGARTSANAGRIIRPCVPDDILKILSRLHRNRQLDMNHFRVLRHYGVRMMAPDQSRSTEHLAWRLWNDALQILGDVLIAKNIVQTSLSAEIISFTVVSW
jgi:hypothetical protein